MMADAVPGGAGGMIVASKLGGKQHRFASPRTAVRGLPRNSKSRLSQLALVIIAHGAVAFAGDVFESGAIDDLQRAALVGNQVSSLKIAGGGRDRLTAHAQHLGEQLVRQRTAIDAEAIM